MVYKAWEGAHNVIYKMTDDCVLYVKPKDATAPSILIRRDIAFVKDDIIKLVVSGVTDIEDYAFRYAMYLKEIVVESVKRIGEFAFEWCEQLEKVDIKTPCIWGFGLFQHCNSLIEVECNTTDTEYKHLFVFCHKLKRIVFPDNIMRYEIYGPPKGNDDGYPSLQEIIIGRKAKINLFNRPQGMRVVRRK